MDRPRICELLGVEPMEEWTMPGVSGRYRITEFGNVEYKRGDDWGPLVTGYVETKFVRALNHPDDIEVKRSWTADDIEDAKAVRRIFPEAVTISKAFGMLAFFDKDEVNIFTVRGLPMFPSITGGETVSLSDILRED